jgi:hypothetical protein
MAPLNALPPWLQQQQWSRYSGDVNMCISLEGYIAGKIVGGQQQEQQCLAAHSG